MRALIVVLVVVAALTCCTCVLVSTDIDCTEALTCGVGSEEVCIFDTDQYCFRTIPNICTWQGLKCEYKLKFLKYDKKYCELENFACK